MRSRLAAFLLVFGLIAVALAAVAVRDHHRSRARMMKAEESEWYCVHTQTRCGGLKSNNLHETWERHEVGYKVGEGALVAAIVVTGGVALLRRRSVATRRSQSPAS